eukprot:m.19540 g.19540  ORF g.19540 m.19540 type:complete len:294 (-) comp10923_c0_seq1:15-896(-)
MASDNYKGQLNEIAMKNRWQVTYDHSMSGPPHMPNWRSAVKVDTGIHTYNATGSGKSKLESQQASCRNVLTSISKHATQSLRHPDISLAATRVTDRIAPPSYTAPETARHEYSAFVDPTLGTAPSLDRAPIGNPKGSLLEYCAQHRLQVEFSHACQGEAHASEWTASVAVMAGGRQVVNQTAKGKTKKIAEHNVSLIALPLLKQGAQRPAPAAAAQVIVTENFKGKLNEICQHLATVPEYESKASGPDHARSWTAVVRVSTPRGQLQGQGSGQAKRMAEQLAARDLLLQIQQM